MLGGAGDDIYFVDNVGDIITENASQGIDTVESSIIFTLAANVENLTLTGTGAINGTGNTLNNILIGNSAANTLNGGTGADILSGGLGDDIYVVDNIGDIITELADEGVDIVQSSITYALGANVENLTLTGTTAINGTGNELDNILTGNSGANTLNGGVGADTMLGGLGNDIYVVDNAGDTITENVNAGTDTVQSSIAYTLGANIENLTLTGTSAINGTGNELNNILTGNSGANVLDGGIGADTMLGGAGDDIYVVDNTGDVITENASQGIDTVESSITFTLATNVENLTLTGTGAINGTGNTLNNILIGNSVANTLNGGTGADTLSGGLGDDVYVVDNIGDIVTELADEGVDTVQSSITYVLGTNVENLTLTGTAAINGTGNELSNILIGNSAANTLNGGVGADTMLGGLGNDIYVVDNVGDIVTENAGAGTDTVQSSIAYTLGANIENLTLTGTSAINGTGNELNNILTGNSGANILNGGIGADTMLGGAGDDTYIVDNIGDIITENANEGIDTIQSSITYTLGSNVENLTLTGTGAINGTGNTLNNILIGNSAANTLNGGTGADTLLGGLGNDIYVVDNVGDIVFENINEGTDAVQSSVTYTLTDNIENLTLTGTTAINGTGNILDNILTGNSGVNILTGGAGNDTLNGGTGADTLLGGLGNDIYGVDNTGDIVTELAGEGSDTVQSSITYILGAEVENLTLTGTSAINGTGNTLDNILTGNSGANILTGGTGNDILFGGLGNDTYVVDDLADVVTENANEGTDTVQTGITYTLGDNLENLTLTGTTAINGTGNILDNILTGNSGVNILTGGAGNDTLNGGVGADTMLGGVGNDIYVVDDVADVVAENANEGTDTVQTGITYTLGANLENLTLTGTTAVNGTGNILDNILTGNSGVNILAGGAGNDTLNGGVGADTMIGGVGNDIYVVDDVADVVTENANEGTDTVQTGITYTLGANLENLTLTGTTAINGTGNILDNILTGNSGVNILTGGAGNDTLNGGAGADTLLGGLGNDIYVVDNTGDIVTELAGEGIDTVQSSITYTLGTDVENLTLTGTSAINGTGNTLDNILIGNTGSNILTGGAGNDILFGGLGNDTLVGGAGNDIFVFDSVLNATTNKDTISDFTIGQDQFRLDKDIFTTLATEGVLSSQYFLASATGAAGDANDYLLYNTTSGALFYDADGNGQGVAIQFATLTTKPAITANDFMIAA
jgi:Ca2+-binding RTX toxin-like protein